MKKLLIATTLGAVALTGCATNAPKDDKPSMPHHHPHKGEHHGHHKHKHKHKHKHDKMTHAYQCNQNTKIIATYNPDTGSAMIKLMSPNLKPTEQEIDMTHAPTGSGMRFVNKTKATNDYVWHAKGADAFLDISANGKAVAEFKCQAEHPKHSKKY